MNKEPERTCIVCRKKGPKENFIKVVKNKNGEVFVEKNKKLDGRGAYICMDKNCILKAEKVNSFSKAFKMQVDKSIYGEIINELNDRKS